MSVLVAYEAKCTVRETLETNVPAATGSKVVITHDQFNSSKALSATTTPPVTKSAAFDLAMVAGVAEIDLTALLGTNGGTVVGTGLKVQVLKVKSKSTNLSAITLAEGAANGYALLGAGWTLDLLPGQEITLFGNDATPDVGATDKIIDVTGTGTEELEVMIVLG